MIKCGTEEIIHTYSTRNPAIAAIEGALHVCVEMLVDCFRNGGQLLICGNGGSCADADHIVGELVKAFRMKRPLEPELSSLLLEQGERGALLARHLQGGLPAINLGAHSALMTAMSNDVGCEYAYAQQVAAYGRKGDILLGISTSGNSVNVLNAGVTARAMGLKTIGLTGKNGGIMGRSFDLILNAEADSVEDIQDLHSAIYHAVCAAVEYEFWGVPVCM